MKLPLSAAWVLFFDPPVHNGGVLSEHRRGLSSSVQAILPTVVRMMIRVSRGSVSYGHLSGCPVPGKPGQEGCQEGLPPRRSRAFTSDGLRQCRPKYVYC